ncbi:tRNA lysidine(34) synthetase TilS [Halomonas sp. 18H]|uniref:tRNA lysidine(34) synthetase TilS n=1 Tax=Halomonas almeriensis TaxID=308163 RepID=UPI0022315364|nr:MULTISPECIES: tRNA lysidine(34) synthetase TilS [Halomonas]MCW4149723.1 tRNA lysidine(34) synthetase TilS [Halomonas sp. 18H]MDN3553332.1 tRNA lysidine(34) synthetase TilS [Halomonas almeriensis]
MSSEASSLQHRVDIALAETPPGHCVWVALSGGLDSSLLLTLAVDASRRHARPLRALHIHHGLQPAADDFERHCRLLCDALAVPLHVERVSVDTSTGEGLEGAARQARQAVFRQCLSAGDTLWLAQHRDDQAETFLLAALRGAGTRGLAGMSQRPPRIGLPHRRPLLGMPRAALEAEAARRGIDWIEDPSNRDTRQDRNFLRHRIVPLLRERWPAAERSLARSAAWAAEAEGLLGELAAEDLARLGGQAGCLRVASLRRLSAARQRLLIRHCLDVQALALPPAARLESLMAQLEARPDAEVCVRWPGAEARVWRGALYLLPTLAPLPMAWRFDWDGQSPLVTPLGAFAWRLQRDDGQPVRLRLAPRQGGERLQLARRGQRDLKRLLQEQGVPPWERQRCWVVWHAGVAVAAGSPAGWLALAEGWRAS